MRLFANKYVIRADAERIGGQGRIVKALDADAEIQVALKFIHPDEADEVQRVFFRRELEALLLLEHPNIVTLLNFGEDEHDNVLYLAMPWFDRDLPSALPLEGDLGWDDFAEKWGLPLLDALAHAHELGVVHRDVKPANILIADDGTPKLADFGISKIRHQMVREATVVNRSTAPYAPPDREGMSSASRDVWGFAATVLRCLTLGRFEDYPDIQAALDDVNVPPQVHDLLAQCTSYDPMARPQNAVILRSRLREIQSARQRRFTKDSYHLQLRVSDDSAKRLAGASHYRDVDAVEEALAQELSQGSFLTRYIGKDGKVSIDTLELIGRDHRMRLAVLGDQPELVLSKVNNAPESLLDKLRREGWRVSDQVIWTSRPQPVAAALEAKRLVLAGLDDHYIRLDDEEHRRVENIIFDRWLKLLEAKKTLELERETPQSFGSININARHVKFFLRTPEKFDILGQDRVCRTPAGRLVGGPGIVIAQDDASITLAYPRKPKGLPQAGELVLNIGPAETALQRQRDAVVNVRAGSSVRPKLRQLLLAPAHIAHPTPPDIDSWFADVLDDDKKAAIASAMGSYDFFLLEGPPGTGKTSFITELVRQEIDRKPDARILLVSQAHVAVDNALVRLAEAGVIHLVRLGKGDNPRIASEVHEHLLEQKLPAMIREVRTRAQAELRRRADLDNIDWKLAEGAATLLELAAVLRELQSARTKLEGIGSSASKVRIQTIDRGDQTPDELIAILEDRIAVIEERMADLQARADVALGSTVALPGEITLQAAEDAFDAFIGRNEKARELVALMNLQAEWLRRVESGHELEGVLLRAQRVVAGTCLGFMSHPAVRELEFDLCIVDEASKATATETLVPLSRSKRWVLVGDTNQLPPMQEEILDHSELMERYGLEPADVKQSLFSTLLDHAPSVCRRQLTQQYRMVAGIGDLVSDCFYNGKLVSKGTAVLPGWDSLYKPVVWLDTSAEANRHEKSEGTSYVNHCEIRIIQRTIKSLLTSIDEGIVLPPEDKPLKVLVLTAYGKQMEQLRRALLPPRSSNLEIEVNTVDAVQGREADITLYSVVRSNKKRKLGFLGPLHWRRINVALSRSRFGLVIVGDTQFCESTTGPLSKVLDYIRSHPETCRIEDSSNG